MKPIETHKNIMMIINGTIILLILKYGYELSIRTIGVDGNKPKMKMKMKMKRRNKDDDNDGQRSNGRPMVFILTKM